MMKWIDFFMCRNNIWPTIPLNILCMPIHSESLRINCCTTSWIQSNWNPGTIVGWDDHEGTIMAQHVELGDTTTWPVLLQMFIINWRHLLLGFLIGPRQRFCCVEYSLFYFSSKHGKCLVGDVDFRWYHSAWRRQARIHAGIQSWMDGWMNGWIDGWMDGLMLLSAERAARSSGPLYRQ